MAAPNTKNNVTTRKLAATITQLWTKLKNTFAPKNDNGSTGTSKFYREDGSWAVPTGSIPAYEHTNEINYRNVAQDQSHWFNYLDGDTDAASPGNLLTDYYFGNRNNSVEGVKLNADGIHGRNIVFNYSKLYCIKLTRLNTTTTDCATVRVFGCGAHNNENMGFIDIIIKMRPSGNLNMVAYSNVRGSTSYIGQCYYEMTSDYQSVGGNVWIAVNICNENALKWVMPMLLGHTMSDPTNPAMKVELGQYSPTYYNESVLETRWLTYIDYNGDVHDSVGSTIKPVFVDSTGKLVPCTPSIPQSLVKTSDFNLYGAIGSYSNYDVVNILNTSDTSISIQVSSDTANNINITSKRFCSFIKYGQRFYCEY